MIHEGPYILSTLRTVPDLLLFGLRVLAAETLDAACAVQNLLFAGKERMASRADFNTNVALMRGAGGKRVTTGALHSHFVVSGMDSCLHCCYEPLAGKV